MSYNPIADFIGLLRTTSGGVRSVRMPGLDYIVAALARMGLFTLSVGTTAPITNQATTVWFQPALQPWAAEGVVFLWNIGTLQYEPATPALWDVLFSVGGGAVFQSVTGANATINAATTLLAIQRAAPANTALALPAVASRAQRVLRIVDWSTGVAAHTITITPDGASETIMRLPGFSLVSTPDQLAGVALYPSTDLNGWVIAP